MSRKYPRGKISFDDQGEIEIGVAADPDKHVVIIAFKNPVQWLALQPDLAKKLARILQEKAAELIN